METAYVVRRLRWTGVTFAALALLGAGSGCAGEVGLDASEGVEDQRQALSVQADWIGYELGLQPPRLVKVGKAEFAPAGTPAVPPPANEGDPNARFIPAEGITSIDSEGNLYQVEFSAADQAKLVEALRAAGEVGRAQLPVENHVEKPGVEFEVEKGLPNGTDNRVVWGMGSNGTGGVSFPQSTQGIFSTTLGSCSATLIDDRVIVMAAHCWFSYPGNMGSGAWGGNQQFSAGRLAAGGAPYGTQGPDPAYVGSIWTAFITNNCHITYNNTICPPLDISWMALASTPRDSGGTSTGYMGFDPTLPNGFTYYLSGYPGCGNPESPASCPTTLYYAPNTGGCTRTSVTTSKYDSNCGGSYGQSGGPFFYYNGTVNDPRLTGVLAGQKCDGNAMSLCTGINEPSILHRITTADYNWMVSLRSMF